MIIFKLVSGLVFLAAGGELLVRGASLLASRLGISSLVIGLTVVAFGTSAPELVVSLFAAMEGKNEIAVANVVGSNIFNVLVILGLSALFAPLLVKARVLRLDTPIMIGASFLLVLLARDGRIGMVEGGLLLAGIAAYTVWGIWESRSAGPGDRAYGDAVVKAKKLSNRLAAQIVMIAAGLGLLVLGGRWLVESAVGIARGLGVSETVIGLTIVAAGTSLPELAASVAAALKGERDIAVGNVIGSNLFNILFIVGASALAAGGNLGVSASILHFDLPVMCAAALVCLPLMFTGGSIARWEGGFLFAAYAAYTIYLILDSSGHDALPAYSLVMGAFVLPLAGVLIIGLSVRGYLKERRAR